MSAAKFKTVGANVCQELVTKNFFHVVRMAGKKYPTKRKLTATTKRAALEEVATLKTRRRESQLGVGLDPYAADITAGVIMDAWEQAGCPNRQDKPRTGEALKAEQAKLKRLRPFWRDRVVSEIASRRHSREYGEDRQKRNKKPVSLGRSIDFELGSLSYAFDWAVNEERWESVKSNPLDRNRKKFYDRAKVRHCTAVMPETDEDFHARAVVLLASDRSRSLGWQYLLEGLTGCRTSEILSCRMDATKPGQPGYMDHHALHLHRCKSGIEPWALLEAAPGHSPLRDCLQAFLHWHAAEHPKHNCFIPGRNGDVPARRTSLTHALHRVSKLMNLPLVVSHGLRAYHVAALRSMGHHDDEVAMRLGHRSTQQVEQTYGTVKPGWRGSWKMDLLPEDSAPAWAAWLPEKSYQILIVPKPKDRIISNPTVVSGEEKIQ